MSGFPFKNIVLPAILAASATFAGLTLPFVFLPTKPIKVDFPPLFSGEIQPIFVSERKDIAIRYVGVVIILSVGTGFATVELIRAKQSMRELAQTQEQISTLKYSLQEKEVQLETLKISGLAGELERLLPDEQTDLALDSSLDADDQEAADIDTLTVNAFAIAPGAILRDCDLSGYNLVGTNLQGTDLCGASLQEADLWGANLMYANLSDAKLIRANFTGANLVSADLSGANLTGANLQGADLTGANLKGAILTEAQLEGATLPDGTEYDAVLHEEWL